MIFEKTGEGAPCSRACPAGVDVPRYVRLIGERKFKEALAVVQEKLPFPSVCGHVCFHPCEDSCNAGYLNGAVAICALKRFVAGQAALPAGVSRPAGTTGKRVAVIGSGPAGLTAAFYLAWLGHAVTVCEALPEPGGMMRYGIPGYRLPRDVLDSEIASIKAAGVEIRTNSRADYPEKLLGEGWDAVFVAVGAQKSVRAGIPGENLPGVVDCLSLMRDLNSGKEVKLGDKVVVIGGGNAAVDAGRVALRLGAGDVLILYRRSWEEMPAHPADVSHALSEGVKIMLLAAPARITAEGGRMRIECTRMRLGEVEPGGRREPGPVPGSEFTLEADTVIFAVGQQPELPPGFTLAATDRGLIRADRYTLGTSAAGVFAGGDAVAGPSSVIKAIASGRQAASSIDRYLGGEGKIEASLFSGDGAAQTGLQGFPVGDRTAMPTLPVPDRLKGFVPVELGFDEEMAVREAGRCLKCDLPIVVEPEKCAGCLTCVMRCSLRHDGAFGQAGAKIRVVPNVGEVNVISFSSQCDACGICARYCPHDALYRGVKRPAEEKKKGGA